MWLLPIFSPVARAALRGYYHFRVDGEAVPSQGPVLLLANHPNSLLDPAAVVAVAGRPVRFLAKAPLFSDRLVGWLIRASGAIPVYRQQEGPGLTARNEDTFRAAHAAIHAGDAVGIFPEGMSHSEPSLVPLRTGAARIALGAAASMAGEAFPIIPIGLVFPRKERFRSEGSCVIGEPIPWDDLADRGDGDGDAVRELTRRIEEGLRGVTINLERREDAPLVLTAERIWNAERGQRLPERERLRGVREVTLGLAKLRSAGSDDWLPLARSVAAHGRKLEALGMRPDQLEQPASRSAARWTVRQIPILGALLLPAILGAVVYTPSYLATDAIARRTAPSPDTEATYKLLVGLVAHLAWTAILATAVGLRSGATAGLLILLALPLLGWSAVLFQDWWRNARATARRFLVRERREALVAELRQRQADIAAGLARLRESVRSGE